MPGGDENMPVDGNMPGDGDLVARFDNCLVVMEKHINGDENLGIGMVFESYLMLG